MYDTSFFRIIALLKPLSTTPANTVVNIKQIPISPYSASVSKRARTKPTKNVTPWPPKASAALQPTPLIILFFYGSSATFYITYVQDK